MARDRPTGRQARRTPRFPRLTRCIARKGASAMTDRNELIDAVKYGLMSIEEGEAAAKEAGLDPLETMPAGERYDPRNRTYWTLAEALAWVQSRNFDAVREFGEAWRNDRMIFVGSDSVLSDGRNIVFEYTRLGPASLIDLWASGVQINVCFDALKGEVGAGNIETTGRPDNGGDRVRIETFRWADLGHFGDVEGSIYVRSADSKGRITGCGFDDVLVKSDGLIKAFPAIDAEKPTMIHATDQQIEDLLKIKYPDHIPRLDVCHGEIIKTYSGTTRESIIPILRKLTNYRGPGRPKKSPK